MITLASGASLTVTFPFSVIQNTYYKDNTLNSYHLGLKSVAEMSAGPVLGTLSGTGGNPVKVTLLTSPTAGSSSTKVILTQTQKLGGSIEQSFATDDGDCTGQQLSICGSLKGGTLSEQKLLPAISGTSTATIMNNVECYCSTVCAAGFYMKTKEEKTKLDITVILTLASASISFVMSILGRVNWLYSSVVGSLFSKAYEHDEDDSTMEAAQHMSPVMGVSM